MHELQGEKPNDLKAEKLINKYVDYIIEEYIKAGGDERKADKNFTYWVLKGIYDREGIKALKEYIKNWKPHITIKKDFRGYA